MLATGAVAISTHGDGPYGCNLADAGRVNINARNYAFNGTALTIHTHEIKESTRRFDRIVKVQQQILPAKQAKEKKRTECLGRAGNPWTEQEKRDVKLAYLK